MAWIGPATGSARRCAGREIGAVQPSGPYSRSTRRSRDPHPRPALRPAVPWHPTSRSTDNIPRHAAEHGVIRGESRQVGQAGRSVSAQYRLSSRQSPLRIRVKPVYRPRKTAYEASGNRDTERFFEVPSDRCSFQGFADQATRSGSDNSCCKQRPATLRRSLPVLRTQPACVKRCEAIGVADQHSIRINSQWRICLPLVSEEGPHDYGNRGLFTERMRV